MENTAEYWKQKAEEYQNLYLQTIDERDQLLVTCNQRFDKIMDMKEKYSKLELDYYEAMCKLSRLGQEILQICRDYNDKPYRYDYVHVGKQKDEDEKNAPAPQKVDLELPDMGIRTNDLFGLKT